LPDFAPLTPENIARGITWYVVLLFSLSFHESAHGWMALQMGDDTAHRDGRISLNPIVHMDPIGTVLMPMMMFFFGSLPFLAWAKPTPVGAHNFRKLAKGHILVAGAGPLSNLLLCLFFLTTLFVAVKTGFIHTDEDPMMKVLVAGVFINVSLAIFNLIPIPPLDGSWIASWGLPRHLGNEYDRVMEPYGWVFLIGLVALSGYVLGPIIQRVGLFLLRLVL
jgi:Zn-dependent protease